MRLASLQGREAEAVPLIQAAVEEAAAVGQGVAVAAADWATASLCHGLGRYADALAAARQAVEHAQVNISMWALPSWSRPPPALGTPSWPATPLISWWNGPGIEGTTARWDGYMEFQRRPQPMLDWFARYMS